MKRIAKTLGLLLAALVLLGALAGAWYVHTRQPERSGTIPMTGLTAPVTVRYDERGVPHLRADHEADLYRALGYVHAQDRLFQMEMVRRLARGELAEILGPKLLDIDRLFRTLGLRAHADKAMAAMDTAQPSFRALQAYLDGVNQFQATHPAPIEFGLLGIPKRDFTPQDTLAVAGYLAYSFAVAFKTEPVLTQIRDQLGPEHLRAFDLAWHPEGVLPPATAPLARLSPSDWQGLQRLAELNSQVPDLSGVPALEGSNAWVISGTRTQSGKPLLAGDPHIAYSAPAVWYEAHLSSPGFELYGHFQALNPMALLGHNMRFGWSLTMFQNDDMDLIAEKPNPAQPQQVWHQGKWVDTTVRQETIRVKGTAPVELAVRLSPHGPIVNGALGEGAPDASATPIAMWWAFLETENPILEAFYALNRADTLAAARTAASKIHAPGLNVVWANAAGDIGWWAAARVPLRPEGVHPNFILDGATAQADKPGFQPFEDNPHEENPARGFIASANQQPTPGSGAPVAGYYNLWDRGQRLAQQLGRPGVKWDAAQSQALQLDVQTGYAHRLLQPLLPLLRNLVQAPDERALLEQMAAWDGRHTVEQTMPTLFHQLEYEIAFAAMADELGPVGFRNLLRTRALDHALPRLAADAPSPWWDNRNTPAVETRADTVKVAWDAALAHLKKTLGPDPQAWTWGRAHTLTHNHPLGQQKPLDRLFSVGPMAAPGGRELPNNLGMPIGPVPWAVTYGPSTRRVIDFADAGQARGINPVGQSGVWFDRHYADQALDFIHGVSQPQHLLEPDVAAHTRSTLALTPAH